MASGKFNEHQHKCLSVYSTNLFKSTFRRCKRMEHSEESHRERHNWIPVKTFYSFEFKSIAENINRTWKIRKIDEYPNISFWASMVTCIERQKWCPKPSLTHYIGNHFEPSTHPFMSRSHICSGCWMRSEGFSGIWALCSVPSLVSSRKS